jgi:hypothetical protein
VHTAFLHLSYHKIKYISTTGNCMKRKKKIPHNCAGFWQYHISSRRSLRTRWVKPHTISAKLLKNSR